MSKRFYISVSGYVHRRGKNFFFFFISIPRSLFFNGRVRQFLLEFLYVDTELKPVK